MMGSPKQFLPDNKFAQYLYTDHEKWEPVNINGIIGKVIRKITDLDGLHTSLPLGAGNSNMYFRLDGKGEVVQGRLYINRYSFLDFDWGHDHYNNPRRGLDGETFSKGVVHVQKMEYSLDMTNTRALENARFMTDEEISKYGPIIKHFAPNVRFRP